MKVERKIRFFVILVSLIIFCYQIETAFYHLMSEATVDSTEYISISDLDSPPLITICPRQELNWQTTEEWGWGHEGDPGYQNKDYYNILLGKYLSLVHKGL